MTAPAAGSWFDEEVDPGGEEGLAPTSGSSRVLVADVLAFLADGPRVAPTEEGPVG